MYKFLSPTTTEQACKLLRDTQNLRILAGGTDLIIALKDNIAVCDYVMDIKKIPSLNELEESADGLSVGAAVTIGRLKESGLLQGCYHALFQSASELANSLLRNRATLAGNICNASPGGDMLPSCLALGAWVETMSANGGRRIALENFFTGPKKHVLTPDEMVVRTVIPKSGGFSTFRKKKRIRGHDLAQISVACSYGTDKALTLAFGAAAPTPVKLELGSIERAQLRERKYDIVNKAAEFVKPIGDVRSSKEYRLAMIRHMTAEVIEEILERMEA